MNKTLEDKCYSGWRRREAYMVPMTQQGTKLAEQRYEEFKKGWEYGIRYAIFLAEQEHKDNKYFHKFYLFFANKLRGMFK